MRVILHGGAVGPPDEPAERQDVLDGAAAAATGAATPIDAVETAVRRLESSPRFNAGVGGAVQCDGVPKTDAGVMTSDRETGAACSMPGVEHAVSVARAVMEETPHVLVSGEHAVRVGKAFGVETGVDLWTESSRERYEAADPPDGVSEQLAWMREEFGGADTVGAVAFDGESFAAGTSTRGRWFALEGRVGDSPMVGSGFYCGPAGGASATGAGEDIARTTLCRRAVGHLEAGHDAATAARLAIDEFAELTGSYAGLIVMDEAGTGSHHNSDGMQTAVDSG
jgi:isoaspartyl peptidase/L-asparaginase-like protein (Ntn-hydrolase superfamily)